MDEINFITRIINDDSAWRWIDEVVLMQFTGLHDRNDKEIYEGDIVKFINTDDKYYIAFAEGTFTLEPHKMFICNIEANNLEVIGNIYENPKLLNKEEYKE